IDPASNTVFVASTSEGPTGTFHQRLHGLDLFSGREKFAGPVTVSASVPGTGYDSVNGRVSFDAKTHLQRSALALLNAVVSIAWASYGDRDPFHGWIVGYDAASLAPVAVFADSSNGQRGGIWMSGGALAADTNGNLFVSTGNGTFDADSATPPNSDFGNTI